VHATPSAFLFSNPHPWFESLVL